MRIVRFIRIQDWYYLIGIAYLGFCFQLRRWDTAAFAALTLVASLYLAQGYSLNHYFDIVTKEKDGRGCLVGGFGLRRALCLSIGLLALNLIVAFFHSKAVLGLVVIGAAIGFLYSSPRTYLKNKFFLNIILNSTGFTVLFLVGYFSNKPLSSLTFYTAGYMWLGIVPEQLIHLMAHRTVEGALRISFERSFVLLYSSLFLWLAWSFVCFAVLCPMGPLFLATLVFCAFQVAVIEIGRYRHRASVEGVQRLRAIFKYANVPFGILLIFLFLML